MQKGFEANSPRARVANNLGGAAVVAALKDWRRHALALAVIGVAGVAAVLIGSREAVYAAGLIAFSVWMVWFVMTAIEWVKRADF